MPVTSAALQDAVDQQVGLVLAERLAQHALTYSSVSVTSMLWLAGQRR